VKYISFQPLWFDSLGAKSSSVLVETPDVKVVIDPGIAVMQPTFPASWAKKVWWVEKGKHVIKQACKKANLIIVTHYHYDHHFPNDMDVYEGKVVLAKNPNHYINDSQRGRAERFYDNFCRSFGGVGLEDVLEETKVRTYPNPLDAIPLARDKDFGDYNRRRKELFRKGLKWFRNRVTRWKEYRWIPELDFKRTRVRWADGQYFEFGKTRIRFTPPLFHGIEFSRVGWVITVIIEHKGEKLIHSSDLNGLYIEDYAKLLMEEDARTLILDGPPTYMGFMLIKINLQRCIYNTCEIIKKSKHLKLLLYDHHLLREKKYRERTRDVWITGKKKKVKVVTAAEYLGKRPVVDQL